jgi:hypothetical protein
VLLLLIGGLFCGALLLGLFLAELVTRLMNVQGE